MKAVKLIICIVIYFGSLILAFGQPGMATPLRVGAARVDITPSENTLPKGYYNIHDRLYCRAIVIDNGSTLAALISVDMGMVSNDLYDKVTKEIEKETRIPSKSIFLSPSHTHSAPWELSSHFPLIEVVKMAIEKLQPARISFGTGLSYININRDVIDPVTRLWTQGPNYEGPSDKTVAVISFKALNGDPMAVYYNYAMHANTMFMSGSISADFPGETSKYIEDYYDNKIVAMFSSGAAGDQNPISIKPMTDVGSKKTDALLASGKAKELNEAIMMAGMGGESDIKIDARALTRQSHMISTLGQLLGEEVLRVMKLPQKSDSVVRIISAHQTVTCPGRKRTNVGREGAPGTYVEGEPVHIKLCLLKVGDIALAAVNAEVYNIIAQRLKHDSPNSHTIFVSITNGAANSGYIPNDDAFQRYTFQVLSSRLEPNCAETSIIDGLHKMIAEAE
jgi:neutral ceramidase